MSSGTMTAGRAVLRRLVMPAVLLSMTAGAGATMIASQDALASTRTVTTAASGPIVSGYHRNKCVDDLGDSMKNDTPIVISDCNGSPEQTWTIETDGTIQVNSKCLDVFRDEKTNKAMVELWTCHAGLNQQWQAVNGALENPVSRKCLDDPRFNTANGTHLDLYTCNGGRNQKWVLP
jgi:hypothetical protein